MSKLGNRAVPVLAVLVVLGLVGAGLWWWIATPAEEESRSVWGSVETTRYQTSSTIAGLVEEVLVAEGDAVMAGHPLVRLDDTALRLAVEQATSGVDAAKALVAQHEADGTDAEVAEAKARQAQAEAGLQLAEFQLAQAVISAPHDGVVITVTTNAGQAAAAGRTLVTLSDLTDVWVRAFVPQPDLGSIDVGTKLQVSAAGADSVEGTVTWVSTEPEFTPNSVQTKDQRARLVYQFRVQLPSDAVGYRAGQPVDVFLP